MSGAPVVGYDDAWEAALGLLAASAKSAAELDRRLQGRGAPAGVRAAVLARLSELGLVDDRAVARALVERRAGQGRAPAAIVAELAARGVAPEAAAAALEGLDAEAAALEAAAARARRLAHLPLSEQAARLHAHLLRRGFEPEVAEAAVRRVLPPEGWD